MYKGTHRRLPLRGRLYLWLVGFLVDMGGWERELDRTE